MNLGAFGEWWNGTVGVAWNSLEWGTVPAWVGSILTSVSVFLALLILVNDRRMKKREMADGFTTWMHYSTTASSFNPKADRVMTIVAYNASDFPIPVAWITTSPNSEAHINDFFKGSLGKDNTVEPKERIEKVLTIDSDPKNSVIYTTFMDARNRVWHRDLSSAKYISARRVKRWDKTESRELRKMNKPLEKQYEKNRKARETQSAK